MKRYEEIKEMAKITASHITSDKDMQVAFADVLRRGAEWADEHPKQIEISLEDIEELAKEVIPEDWADRQETLWVMIRRNQRAHFIIKACDWLDKRLDSYNISWIEDEYCWSKEMFLKQFKQAMEGE